MAEEMEEELRGPERGQRGEGRVKAGPRGGSIGISMAPVRLRRQSRMAVWTQGGGCCLAILSTGPRSLLPGLQGLAASSRSTWASRTELSVSASFSLLLAVPEALFQPAAGRKTPGSQIAHKSINLEGGMGWGQEAGSRVEVTTPPLS